MVSSRGPSGSKSRTRIFTDRYPLLGSLIWILSAQHFSAQFIVASAWGGGYSWAHNLISDLGATVCGSYFERYVCSPEHALMNASFIMLGLTMALGSWLIYQEFSESYLSFIGFSLMALAGFGVFLIGLFPENSIGWIHDIGALFALGFGNISLIVLSFALKRVRKIFRAYTFLSGAVSLAALAVFLLGYDLGLGFGTLERIVSYPQTIWLILFGLYMTGSHYQSIGAIKTTPE